MVLTAIQVVNTYVVGMVASSCLNANSHPTGPFLLSVANKGPVTNENKNHLSPALYLFVLEKQTGVDAKPLRQSLNVLLAQTTVPR